MTTISTQLNIDRAKRAIRSKLQHVMESRHQPKIITMEKPSKRSNVQDSPQKKVFETFFSGRARRTMSFMSSKHQGKAAGAQDMAAKSPTLGERFFSLPIELQLSIVNNLFFFDLLNLRQTSKRFRDLTIQHEGHIVRHHIHMWVPKHIIELYPPPASTTPTISYLTDLAYKQKISTQLALVLANQIVKEMMGSRQQRAMSREANDYVISQLRLGTSPLIFALFHFLETYRERKLEHLTQGDLNADRSSTVRNPLSHEKNMALQSEILKYYPDDLLLQVHQMYHLLLHMLIRRLSPSRKPFGLRTLSRWSSQRPTNEAFAKVLVLGGIREVWELYKIKGYSNRRKALEKYLKKLDSDKMDHVTTPNEHTENNSSANDGKRVSRSLPGRGPSLDIPSKVARLDVDELMDVWTPAAEERLLSREIITSLDEIGCCGHFVSLLLGSTAETDNEEDGEDSDDEDDSGDDMPNDPGAANGIHYTGGSTSDQDNTWDGADLHEEQEHDDDDDDEGSFGDDEGAGSPSSA